MDYVFSCDALSKSYGHCMALDNLTMHIPAGAIYGFVGKNGAGKTTLIRLLCGLQLPTDGSFSLYGKKNTDKDIGRVRRRLGAVVETPSVYAELSARDNLKIQYRILGLPSYDGMEELLAFVRLADTGKKKAKDFSLGMRQRLGIAIALAGDPAFLVLDEPTNGLDPQGIVEIRELILRLNREKHITVLISSHILDELARLATHYGFIDRGRMVKEMTAAELEASCRKCLRVTVSDCSAMTQVLDALGLEYSLVSDNCADIFGEMNLTRLTLALAEQNCEIIAIHERDESLESYYIGLVGGDENE